MSGRTLAPPAKAIPNMPVDHPDSAPVAVRRMPNRMLTVVVSFLVTLGALFALSPMLRIDTFLT